MKLKINRFVELVAGPFLIKSIPCNPNAYKTDDGFKGLTMEDKIQKGQTFMDITECFENGDDLTLGSMKNLIDYIHKACNQSRIDLLKELKEQSGRYLDVISSIEAVPLSVLEAKLKELE